MRMRKIVMLKTSVRTRKPCSFGSGELALFSRKQYCESVMRCDFSCIEKQKYEVSLQKHYMKIVCIKIYQKGTCLYFGF